MAAVTIPACDAVAVLLLAVLSGPAMAVGGGQVDADDRYAAVVSIEIAGTRRCTATLVARRLLLTAAHGVVDVASGELLQPLDTVTLLREAGRGPNLALQAVHLPDALRGALQRFADYRSRHPRRGDRIGPWFSARFPDVALLRLARPLAGVEPLPLRLAPLPEGAPVVLVGWGCGPADSQGRGLRRWALARVQRVDGVNLYMLGSLRVPGAPSLCHGDSGGPVLHEGRVAGVAGAVWGWQPGHGARSSMAASLHALRDWSALRLIPAAAP